MSAVEELARRIRLVASSGEIHRTDGAAVPRHVQATLVAGETIDRLPHLQHFGFASRPPAGTRGVVLSLGADRAQPVLIATGHREFMGPELAEGEVALFSRDGTVLHLGDDASLTGSLDVSGQLRDFRSSLEEMRLVFDAHVHPSPGSPTTTPMIPGAGGAGEPESSYLEGGSGPPDPALEREPGSYWTDLTSGVVYERELDAWVQTDLSLRGEAGDPGTVWYGSSGAPTNNLGRATDWHLDLANGDVRQKSIAGWVLLGNIQGAKGDTGATGPPGTTDHGALTDLLSDHHPQYLLADGSRPAATLSVAGDIGLGGLIDGRDPSVDGPKLDKFALGTTARHRLVWNANESRWDAELDRVKVQTVFDDFSGPSGGVYTVQVPAAQHGLGADVDVRAWDTSSSPGSRVAFDSHALSINASGDITLQVSVSPDGRRDVLFIVSRTL